MNLKSSFKAFCDQNKFEVNVQQIEIIDLLDSIYNYYPIGSFILWETKEQLSASRNIAGYILPNVDPDWPFYYVLDGQQRI